MLTRKKLEQVLNEQEMKIENLCQNMKVLIGECINERIPTIEQELDRQMERVTQKFQSLFIFIETILTEEQEKQVAEFLKNGTDTSTGNEPAKSDPSIT